MAPRADSLDLGTMRLTSGEGRRMELDVPIEPFELSGETYDVLPESPTVRLDISRTTGSGYALRIRFEATLSGPCMRCLELASPTFAVDAREVSQPGEAEELDLDSPYVDHQVLDISAWVRDALALALPSAILCRPDCAGLCPKCGVDLNAAGPEHRHEPEPDARWAKLAELRFPEETA